MVQLLGGLIIYLLLAIYCREQYNKPVSIRRIRELRHQIANEAAEFHNQRPRRHDSSRKTKRLGRKKR